ncbi:hypothetical protein [Nocardia nova]|uniref:hypothetical protein n=1 Tax=Nocardia nova TaxID=37330 RepID=UPI0033D673A7
MPDRVPNTRYHTDRARDTEARADHARVSRTWRRDIARAAFDTTDQAALFAALRAGHRITTAARTLGFSHAAVYGRARWDTAFADALEKVLTETCPAGDHCGTPAGKRHHHGHCQECRAAHRGQLPCGRRNFPAQ